MAQFESTGMACSGLSLAMSLGDAGMIGGGDGAGDAAV
jgi:hypothetical protein